MYNLYDNSNIKWCFRFVFIICGRRGMNVDIREVFVRWIKLFGSLIKLYGIGLVLFVMGRFTGLLDCFNIGLKYLIGYRFFYKVLFICIVYLYSFYIFL